MLLKGNSGKIIVGYDLGSACSQISYCGMDGGEPETLSAVAGSESFQIPTALCKRNGVNQWFFGREALKCAEEGQGILVENLLELASDGEPVLLEGESYEPAALLTLFIKRSLSLLSSVRLPADKIGAFLMTAEKLDHKLTQVLARAAAGLSLRTETLCFQSHAESFYYYMLRQPPELWAFQTILLDYAGSRIRAYRMECNKRTTPVVAFVEIREYPFPGPAPAGETAAEREERYTLMDRELLRIARDMCEGSLVSSVYLIGEGYSGEWLKEALRYLCRNRRVFQGSNLYSKGACYGMVERIHPGPEAVRHVFLGNDKLKANIGMKALRRGEESYYALLDAGTNWYEAEAECEFYLREENSVELTIAPLIGRNARVARIALEGLKKRPVRMRMKLHMEEENRLTVELEDLGFGEFEQASHRVWTQRLEVY